MVTQRENSFPPKLGAQRKDDGHLVHSQSLRVKPSKVKGSVLI